MCLVMQRENSRGAFTALAPAHLFLLFERLKFLSLHMYGKRLTLRIKCNAAWV